MMRRSVRAGNRQNMKIRNLMLPICGFGMKCGFTIATKMGKRGDVSIAIALLGQ